MLSSHLLVFLCCSTLTTTSLRLSLLKDVADKLEDQEVLQAEVEVWMSALKAMWEWEEAIWQEECEIVIIPLCQV